MTKKTIARSDEKKQELRELILDAAREIAVKNGFDALSLRKIAAKIGYAPGTIYLYFKDREELTREICTSGFASLGDAMSDAADAVEPSEKLAVMLKAYAKFAMQNSEIYRLAFMEDPRFTEAMFRVRPDERQKAVGRKPYSLLVNGVRELKKLGKIDQDADEIMTAEMFWSAIHGIVSLKIIYPAFPTTETNKLVDKVVDGLLNGV